MSRTHRPIPLVVLLLLMLVASACGSGGGSGTGGAGDPVATAEPPATVLVNSQYPQLDVGGLKRSWLVDSGEHLTHVLSFVDGLSIDEAKAADALRYFERLRVDIELEVPADAARLTYRVRPRNYPQRYVVIVPDGAPLPQWAGRPEAARSFTSTRPVNVDHAVTLIRVAEKPFVLGAPFEELPRAAQLDAVFFNAACARSTSITTDPDAAYTYGANIHNRGEGVICAAEGRQLAGRRLGMPASVAAEIAAANRFPPAPAQGPALAAPPFDESRYAQLPAIGVIFSLS